MGVYTYDPASNTLDWIANGSTVIPGTSLTFESFAHTDTDGQSLVFTGHEGFLCCGGQGGVYLAPAGSSGAGPFTVLAEVDQPVPGNPNGATFDSFAEVAVDGDLAVLTGFFFDPVTGNTETGLYGFRDGTLFKIIDSTEELDGSPLINQHFTHRGLDGDQLVFNVKYEDPGAPFGQGSAIWVATMPSLIESVVSRKTHGSAGVFEINLPFVGGPAVEGRSGTGPSANTHQLVFRFLNPIANVDSVSATATSSGGPQPVSASGAVNPSDAKEYIVTLSGVPNAQFVTANLANAQDTSGNTATSLSATLGILLGDVNGNGSVNSTDVGETKSSSGQTNASNFRTDVTINGATNSSDVGVVKINSGTGLPASPSQEPQSSKQNRK